MKFVGLTGGIGAGKSAALAALGRLGASTLSTDEVVHSLYADDEEMCRLMVERWGEQVLAEEGGGLDRGKVADVAFSSDEERKFLEQTVWPRVGARMWEWRQASERDGAQVAVVEVPLLFESGMDQGFDATIAVVADEDVRRQRAGARGHKMVDERTARQLSQDEKASRATYVVRNSGTLDELEQELSALLAKLSV